MDKRFILLLLLFVLIQNTNAINVHCPQNAKIIDWMEDTWLKDYSGNLEVNSNFTLSVTGAFNWPEVNMTFFLAPGNKVENSTKISIKRWTFNDSLKQYDYEDYSDKVYQIETGNNIFISIPDNRTNGTYEIIVRAKLNHSMGGPVMLITYPHSCFDNCNIANVKHSIHFPSGSAITYLPNGASLVQTDDGKDLVVQFNRTGGDSVQFYWQFAESVMRPLLFSLLGALLGVFISPALGPKPTEYKLVALAIVTMILAYSLVNLNSLEVLVAVFLVISSLIAFGALLLMCYFGVQNLRHSSGRSAVKAPEQTTTEAILTELKDLREKLDKTEQNTNEVVRTELAGLREKVDKMLIMQNTNEVIRAELSDLREKVDRTISLLEKKQVKSKQKR